MPTVASSRRPPASETERLPREAYGMDTVECLPEEGSISTTVPPALGSLYLARILQKTVGG